MSVNAISNNGDGLERKKMNPYIQKFLDFGKKEGAAWQGAFVAQGGQGFIPGTNIIDVKNA